MYARCRHINGFAIISKAGFCIVFVYGCHTNYMVVRCRIHRVGYIIVTCGGNYHNVVGISLVEKGLFGSRSTAAAPRHTNYINAQYNGILYAFEARSYRAAAVGCGFNRH